MEDIIEIYEKAQRCIDDLIIKKNEYIRELFAILDGGHVATISEVSNSEVPNGPATSLPQGPTEAGNLTPQPIKKRAKRLTALDETEEDIVTPKPTAMHLQKQSVGVVTKNEAQQLPVTYLDNKTHTKSTVELMPPPPIPAAFTFNNGDQTFSRPQRAAKLNCEKNLKEPLLNKKLRRPSNLNSSQITVKLEHEQRASQMHELTRSEQKVKGKSKTSTASTSSQDSVIAVPSVQPILIDLVSSETDLSVSAQSGEGPKNNESMRQLQVRIKREKISIDAKDAAISKTIETEILESAPQETLQESLKTSTTSEISIQTKKTNRKKKGVPMPIKIERVSDVTETQRTELPIAGRTRKASFDRAKNNSIEAQDGGKEHADREATIYEEALDIAKPVDDSGKKGKISASQKLSQPTTAIDATVVLGTAPADATYCTASAATFVLDPQNPNPDPGGDLTFDVANGKMTNSQRSSKQSMETARDTLRPYGDSLMTEDNSYESSEAINHAQITESIPAIEKPSVLPSSKGSKLQVRTIEIFNPLVQSPVKKKVEAFENAAATMNCGKAVTRSKLVKENNAPTGTATTPVIGKLHTATLGRFLTPTQSSNIITPNAVTKKIPASASKAMTLPKSSSTGNFKSSSSVKALNRENSAEEFRKGIQQMAEERKKQREQKHFLAAQQREAKERERAERMAKVAKEREEKRLKKQKEAEQKKRELEEIQRKLKLAQEEAVAADVAKEKTKFHIEQEKAVLQQMKQPQHGHGKTRMPPPQPKIKYTFEMLHEDDSTDEETKITYKRPAPPSWSRSHIRGPAILHQQWMPTEIIDSFFSVQPMTPDLKNIFPTIDSRYLKRNSSAIWATPPRYSELPKY